MSIVEKVNNMSPEELMDMAAALKIAASERLQQNRNENIGKSVEVVVKGLKKIKSDLEAHFDELNNVIQAKVGSISNGRDGKPGRDGKDGKDGRIGVDGIQGPPGAPGQDGEDGEDGISVVNAFVDFDGGLTIVLSDGREINAGEVIPMDVAEKIKVITNGGGTSQSVLDSIASLQSQIDTLIPSQTGNSGKFLTTNGTVTSWATVSGGGSGTVTSVAATVPAFLSITGSPITTSGTLAIGLSGTALPVVNGGTGTTTPSIVAGTNVTVTGTWPNQTINSTGGGSSTLTISNKTAAYTVIAGDNGTVINCTSGTFTVSLTAAATLGSGFNVTIWNSSSTATDVITIDPNGAETIENQTTRLLRRGEGMQIICDGTNWRTGNKKTMRGYAENFEGTTAPPIASGSAALAIGVGSTASGGLSTAIGFSASSTSTYSTAIGVNSSGAGSQTVSGSGAMALGGSYASGTDSFAAGTGNNTSTYGAQASGGVAIGSLARGTGTNSVGIGRQSIGSSTQSIAIGGSSSSSAAGSVAIGGNTTVGWGANASGADSFAFGDGANSRQIKKVTFAGWNGTVSGAAQYGLLVVVKDTTNATATVLTSDTAAASTNNQLILQNNQAMVVTGSILCRQSVAGSDKASAWTFTAVIRRGANAGTTALVAAVTPVLVAQDVSLATTAVSVTADTTNGGLAVTVTGIAATNLRWAATLQSTELVYA